MNRPTYDKYPAIAVPAAYSAHFWAGWEAVLRKMKSALAVPGKRVLAVECYPGVSAGDLVARIGAALDPSQMLASAGAFKSPEEIDILVASDLGGDDPIFGCLSRLAPEDFLDEGKIREMRGRIAEAGEGIVAVVGFGASIIAERPDLLVYADMPRWEGQLRQRRGEVDNLGSRNRGQKASLQYKRSFFVDWRVADRLKRRTMERWDFLLDTTDHSIPKLISGQAHLAALRHSVTRPFRLVPFFDPGPWGGQWMREVCGLPDGPPNYAWGFDCVPEENSLLLEFEGGARAEIPAINLVFNQPRALLGEAVYGRFGAEFPIRFDFLDTMGGGNLSFQVHPHTEYAREQFGLTYTQDESYYLLDAGPGATVYLGRKSGVRPEEMLASLEDAQAGGPPFDDGKYAASFPAKKHDHFLIPAGTLHCSGAGCMVLEISATPYIFTFKLWDWGRLGLDGFPRPLNIERGKAVIRWDRDEGYARANLVNQTHEIARGVGWSEERTGLHEAEFIETRRHWFTTPVLHSRTGSVEVLNLVEGDAAVVESPSGFFDPFEVHYAETFVLPDGAGDYTVRPLVQGRRCGTIKAFVRCRA